MSRFLVRGCRAGLIRIKCRRLVAKNSFTFVIEIFKLAALHGPAKHSQDHEHEPGGQRNQQVQAFHDVLRQASAGGAQCVEHDHE